MKSQLRTHHVDRPIRISVVNRLTRRAGRLPAGVRGEADHVPWRDRRIRSCDIRRSGLCARHAAKAHALLERGDGAAARAAMGAANSVTAGLSPRETSHIAFFDLL